MVKNTQTICRLLPTNCLSVFNHFLGLVLKGLNLCLKISQHLWKCNPLRVNVPVFVANTGCPDNCSRGKLSPGSFIQYMHNILRKTNISCSLIRTVIQMGTLVRNGFSCFCSHKQPLEQSTKKMFLQISQNSQENTCVRVSFLIKLQVSGNTFLQNTSRRLFLYSGFSQLLYQQIFRRYAHSAAHLRN